MMIMKRTTSIVIFLTMILVVSIGAIPVEAQAHTDVFTVDGLSYRSSVFSIDHETTCTGTVEVTTGTDITFIVTTTAGFNEFADGETYFQNYEYQFDIVYHIYDIRLGEGIYYFIFDNTDSITSVTVQWEHNEIRFVPFDPVRQTLLLVILLILGMVAVGISTGTKKSGR